MRGCCGEQRVESCASVRSDLCRAVGPECVVALMDPYRFSIVKIIGWLLGTLLAVMYALEGLKELGWI